MGVQEKYIPCGILDEDTGQLYLNFGSSYKTSDFIVDSLSWWWKQIPVTEKQQLDLIQIKTISSRVFSVFKIVILGILIA